MTAHIFRVRTKLFPPEVWRRANIWNSPRTLAIQGFHRYTGFEPGISWSNTTRVIVILFEQHFRDFMKSLKNVRDFIHTLAIQGFHRYTGLNQGFHDLTGYKSPWQFRDFIDTLVLNQGFHRYTGFEPGISWSNTTRVIVKLFEQSFRDFMKSLKNVRDFIHTLAIQGFHRYTGLNQGFHDLTGYKDTL